MIWDGTNDLAAINMIQFQDMLSLMVPIQCVLLAVLFLASRAQSVIQEREQISIQMRMG